MIIMIAIANLQTVPFPRVIAMVLFAHCSVRRRPKCPACVRRGRDKKKVVVEKWGRTGVFFHTTDHLFFSSGHTYRRTRLLEKEESGICSWRRGWRSFFIGKVLTIGKVLRLFLMATWKSGLGNFSGTNLSHVTMGGNLLH